MINKVGSLAPPWSIGKTNTHNQKYRAIEQINKLNSPNKKSLEKQLAQLKIEE